MYWQSDLETMPRERLEGLQAERLRNTVRHADRAPYYHDLFQQQGLRPESIRHLTDLARLPFTTKEDLRNHYPYGLLGAEHRDLRRLHCSSGTTGNPTVIFHDQHDLDAWANLVARSMYCAGARDSDVFQNICGYGLFTGGLGFQYGAERLGALTIPAGAGNTRRQIKLMRDFSTSVIHTIPSYLMRLRAELDELHIDPTGDLALRIILTGAEPHSEETRQRVQAAYGVPVFNSYGLSEMNGPGVAFECTEQAGMHLWEDAFLLEVIHPETLQPVPEGQLGELVLTTLERRAMPLIRYRTRDLTRILPGPCPCGRSHRRIDRIAGRSDDMLIIRGCNVFPMQIERILMAMPEVGHNYLIHLITVKDLDEIHIEVEMHPEHFSGIYADLEALRGRIEHEVANEILVRPRVKLLEPGALPQTEGKAVRVRDSRQ